MKAFFKKIALIMFGLLFLVACGADDATIRVGSKDFTENLIVAEVYALALEDNGHEVERVHNIASSVIPQSIANDEIDIYPEYTGTALISILDLPMEKDPDLVAEIIKSEYEAAGQLTTLDYAPANDSQGIAIQTAVAEEMDIWTISDLQENASEIRFASQGEFDLRVDGLVGLAEVYGEFNFQDSTVYDNSLKYQILSNDEADATPAYTTEGQLVSDEFTVLEDDQNFWPPYNIIPIVRQDILEAHPEISDIINAVNETLTTEIVIALNARVDIDGEEFADVAADYYETILE